MDLQEVRNKAREKMKGCHVCPQCNGKACIGMIPGFGGLRTGRSFMRNVEALQEYGLVMRSMSGVDDPDTTVTILGKTLSMPVLLAPVGGIVLNAKVDGDPAEVEQEYDEAVTQAALEAGTLCFTGDSGAPYMYMLRGLRLVRNGLASSFRLSSPAATTRSSRRPIRPKPPVPLPWPATSMRRR